MSIVMLGLFELGDAVFEPGLVTAVFESTWSGEIAKTAGASG
jgi:hypothetical protein